MGASFAPRCGSADVRRGLALAAMTLIGGEALAEISPFTSDGCSAFPDGTPSQRTLWLDCCHEHDFAYWKGGTRQQRAEADRTLRACVKAFGEPEIAALMLAGVRVGGTPYLPTRFRWGYGWPYFRGYKPLSAEELRQIEELLAEPGLGTSPLPAAGPEGRSPQEHRDGGGGER